ncbi:hypothetical protein HA402_003782 [Bradysia odoriphaga]|nr:hypothetical protein HA402_003782 [Bradysia odoriphaga]
MNKTNIWIRFGWVYGETWQANSWDFRQAMITIQSKYGVFPFFKFTVVNRNSKPFGNIIKISEGEYGLPHKMFYNLETDHKIIRAYKLLLRDFAINFGVVSDNARKFADEVFHFEKRIVNSLPERRQNVILTLSEVQKKAPSLPISETITTTFSKLNDQTLILVEDEALLSQLSIIASTTDESPLNNFLTWSLVRHFLPFMSREYRAALQEFNSDIYGIERPQPIWYFCTKLIKNWMPFAIDGLRQNPRLIVTASPNSVNYNGNDRTSDFLIQDRTNYNQELLKMIFYHLRHQMKRSIDENVAIDQEITTYINDKLSQMKLQIGIPSELLKDEEYLNKFYKEFYWRKLHFLDNLEHHWTFVKRKMEVMMEPMNVTDKIIANLYSPAGSNDNQLVQYSIDLNTIIVSNRAVEKPFFHFKYPISVNFARIGEELSKLLLNAVFRIGEQYKDEFYANHKLVNKTRTPFSLGETDCIERLSDPKIPQTAKDSLVSDVTSGRFTSNCLAEFLRLMEASQPVPDSELPDTVTYDLFDLRQRKRQPGLRSFDDMQLFSLVYMQRYCSVTNGHYKHYKAFVEMEIPARQGFNINWEQISWLKKSLSCTATKKQCKNIV